MLGTTDYRQRSTVFVQFIFNVVSLSLLFGIRFDKLSNQLLIKQDASMCVYF